MKNRLGRMWLVSYRATWKILVILLVNILVLSGLLYSFEWYLRLSDPFLTLPFDSYYYARHHSQYEDWPAPEEGEYTWGHLVTTNTIGFREREFEMPKPANVCRIMVVGDSLTWGAGLAAEERYTAKAESYLNKYFPGQNFEIVNFGVSGAPTIVERDIVRDYKDLINPDLIIVGFVYNDTQPRSQGYTAEKEVFDKKYAPFFDKIPQALFQIRAPRTANLVRRAFNNFIVIIGLIPPWEVGVQRTYEPDSSEWLAFKQALQDIRAMSDEMDLPPPIFAVLNGDIFVDEPTSVADMDESLPIYLRWYHQAEQMATELGFKAYNHEAELLAQLTPAEIPVNELDAHPSAKVNSIYAQKLFETISTYVDEGTLCQPTSTQSPRPVSSEMLTSRRYMRVRLGDEVRFLGYMIEELQNGDDALDITLGWQALTNVNNNYLIQIYWAGVDGQPWAERTTVPCDGDCPTLQWPANMIAAPGSSIIYWPTAVDMAGLPAERIFEQTHLAYREGSRETIDLAPIPLNLISFPGALIDKHKIDIPPTMPSGEYTLILSMIEATTGERLLAYDEVAESWLPGGEVALGTMVRP